MNQLSLFDQDVLKAIQIAIPPVKASTLQELSKKSELYQSLRKLVDLGYLEVTLIPPGPFGGRPARAYKVTDMGISVLKGLGRMSDIDNSQEDTRVGDGLRHNPNSSRLDPYKLLQVENARLRDEVRVLSDTVHTLNETCRILNGIIKDLQTKTMIEVPVEETVEEIVTEPMDNTRWVLRSEDDNVPLYEYKNGMYVMQTRARLTPKEMDYIVNNNCPKVGRWNNTSYRYRLISEPWGAALGE